MSMERIWRYEGGLEGYRGAHGLADDSDWGTPVKTPRILVVAGVASGVGKTTITLGLLEAFRRRGLVVQGFKVGPDFIDPGSHTLATGRPAFSLDGWMCGRDYVTASVAQHAADADVAVVEGVMGCFDGIDG